MTTPHEYFDEHGDIHLHSTGNMHSYVEPDWLAHHTQAQLPTLSTIGRGATGRGVYPKIVNSQQDGVFRFALIEDETEHQVMLSDNLSAGVIEVHQPNHTPVSGENVNIDICVRRGSSVSHNTVTIPAGAVGSRWFCVPYHVDYQPQHLYQFPVNDLLYDGTNAKRDKPIPRTNDLVVFTTKDGRIIFGNVEAVVSAQAVIVARNETPIPLPVINSDGYWEVNGRAFSAFKAQGPKGDKGDPGVKGDRGPKGDKGDTGSSGIRGEKGDPATIEIGTVSTLLPTEKAAVSAKLDKETNVTTLSFGIPEGKPGKSVDIRGGIWSYDTLPPYDDTEENTAFIVYDGDRQFDLYVRGKYPVQAELGGPWTVVENWQGRPGKGIHYISGYELPPIGESIQIAAGEKDSVFIPSDYIDDDEIVIDQFGIVGIVKSAVDNSGFYEIESIGNCTARIADNSITWDKLATEVQDLINTNRIGRSQLETLFN